MPKEDSMSSGVCIKEEPQKPTSNRTELILMNLGTPEEATQPSVAKYLNEFLTDPYVIGIPEPLRSLLVRGWIVPRRSPTSTKNYQKIWLPEGSPLRVLHERLTTNVRTLAHHDSLHPKKEVIVVSAMRYGTPSLKRALKFLEAKKADQVYIAPLYPQYARATTGSTIEHARKLLKKQNWKPEQIFFLKPFYETSGFLTHWSRAIHEKLKSCDPSNIPTILLSYHGLPQSQVRALDVTKKTCFTEDDCCNRASKSVLACCYRAQAIQTTNGIRSELESLGWNHLRIETSFQSRLGRAKWLQPETSSMTKKLAQTGNRSLLVACPAFTADCLETLEEIELQGRKDFLDHGGLHYDVVSPPNDCSLWAKTLLEWVEKPYLWQLVTDKWPHINAFESELRSG